MCWMRFSCRMRHEDPMYEKLAMENTEPPTYYWVERSFRTEHIKSFEKITAKQTKIIMEDGQSFVVKYAYDALFDTLEYIEYELEWVEQAEKEENTKEKTS